MRLLLSNMREYKGCACGSWSRQVFPFGRLGAFLGLLCGRMACPARLEAVGTREMPIAPETFSYISVHSTCRISLRQVKIMWSNPNCQSFPCSCMIKYFCLWT